MEDDMNSGVKRYMMYCISNRERNRDGICEFLFFFFIFLFLASENKSNQIKLNITHNHTQNKHGVESIIHR